MPTYLTLYKHTPEAKRNISEAPQWLERGEEIVEEMDGELHAVYYGDIGEYDAITIMEFPDRAAIEQGRLGFESDGMHKTESYEIFEPEEYMKLIEERP